MSLLQVQVTHINGADTDLPLPEYETPQSAGMDLRANLGLEDRGSGVTVAAGARALISTGLSIAIPVGFEAQIRPRSGLALKHGISLPNTPGTIDADYRGEVGVILINHGQEPFTIEDGERVAQLVIAKHEMVKWNEVEVLEETERGAGGFGSTGKK